MPNSQLFSCRFRVIILWKFFNLCLVSSFFAPYFVCYFSYSFMGISRETSLYYYWKVTDFLTGYFTRIFPHSLHYIWTFINHFVGVFLKIIYTPSLLLESFKPFVGVFLKKFIKFSHKMVSRFFQSPSIYVRKFSLHLCFGGRFFYHIIAIMRRRVRKLKILPKNFRLKFPILGAGLDFQA